MVGFGFELLPFSLVASLFDRNRKELISCAGLDAQLSLIKGRLFFELLWWISWAIYSLPVPISPRKSKALFDCEWVLMAFCVSISAANPSNAGLLFFKGRFFLSPRALFTD